MHARMVNECVRHISPPALPRNSALTACFSLASPPQNECLYSSDIPAGVRYLHIKLVAKELPAQVTVEEGSWGTERQILGWGRGGRGLGSFPHRSRAGGNQEGHVTTCKAGIRGRVGGRVRGSQLQ